jgi:hypothetical protein
VRRTFPGEDAVGKQIITTAQQIGPLGRNLPGLVPFRVVGVVADIQQAPIGRRSEPVIYHTHRQFPFRAMTVVGRGADTATVVAGLRIALRGLDPSLPLGRVRTMDERLVAATAGPRLLTGVLGTFAVLTAVLAAIGVYGLLAWTVSDRRRELAIRLACKREWRQVCRPFSQSVKSQSGDAEGRDERGRNNGNDIAAEHLNRQFDQHQRGAYLMLVSRTISALQVGIEN